jgi:hypothetical protein
MGKGMTLEDKETPSGDGCFGCLNEVCPSLQISIKRLGVCTSVNISYLYGAYIVQVLCP